MLPMPSEQGEVDWLMVGRWEITRGEYLGSETSGAGLPMTWVNRPEAAAWAQVRGYRLPTLQEWKRMAQSRVGEVRLRGALPGTANTLSLGLHEVLPGGVFVRGQSVAGLDDVWGNVWEWVSTDSQVQPGFSPLAMACGGSYASHELAQGGAPTRMFHEQDKAEDLGFRVVAAAGPWFRKHVEPTWNHQSAQKEWREVFASWSPAKRQGLGIALAREGFPPSLIAAVTGPRE